MQAGTQGYPTSCKLVLHLGEFELHEISAEILFEPSSAVLDLTDTVLSHGGTRRAKADQKGTDIHTVQHSISPSGTFQGQNSFPNNAKMLLAFSTLFPLPAHGELFRLYITTE